jgi:hypothetical protein
MYWFVRSRELAAEAEVEAEEAVREENATLRVPERARARRARDVLDTEATDSDSERKPELAYVRPCVRWQRSTRLTQSAFLVCRMSPTLAAEPLATAERKHRSGADVASVAIGKSKRSQAVAAVPVSAVQYFTPRTAPPRALAPPSAVIPRTNLSRKYCSLCFVTHKLNGVCSAASFLGSPPRLTGTPPSPNRHVFHPIPSYGNTQIHTAFCTALCVREQERMSPRRLQRCRM